MKSSAIRKGKPLKCGVAIRVLSAIAFICVLLYFIVFLVTMNDYKLEFDFLNIIDRIDLLLFRVSPIVIFFIYVFKLYNKAKASILVPIVLALSSFHYLLNCLIYCYIVITLLPLIYSFSVGIAAFCVLIFITFVLAVISALKGLNKKIFIIIPIAGAILYTVDTVVAIIGISGSIGIETIGFYSICAGEVLFYIALLIFGIKNIIPPIISSKKSKTNPEMELLHLKAKFDFGEMTEEEYQQKRAEIISKI